MTNLKDKAYFSEIMEANKRIILKVAYAYCPWPEERDDLVQEILIQLWNSREKYNKQFKLSTWIYRVALNVSISFYRKQILRDNKTSIINENLPDETESANPKIQMLHQFINQLKELDKAIMLLYLEDKSHREISEIMGISESNVGTKINRIKKKLKQQFENNKDTES